MASASPALDNGHWRFPTQLDYSKAEGFVYLIRCVSTGQMYIGRKNFRVGRKPGGRLGSNWRSYTSSSNELNELIRDKGKDDFQFFVLEQYYTTVGMMWGEVWSQAFVEAPTNKRFLNVRVEGLQWRSKEQVTSLHKARLMKLLAL
jgi:hypothetical protein